MDLLEKLKAGRDAISTVRVNGVEIGLRILTEQDYQTAGLAADALLRTNGTELSMATADLFEAEKSIQLIALMVVDPATKKPVFVNADEARKVFTREDKEVISEAYIDHERSFSPSGRTMTDADFEALLEEVKKNPATPRLNDLSGAGLKRLITSLAVPPSS